MIIETQSFSKKTSSHSNFITHFIIQCPLVYFIKMVLMLGPIKSGWLSHIWFLSWSLWLNFSLQTAHLEDNRYIFFASISDIVDCVKCQSWYYGIWSTWCVKSYFNCSCIQTNVRWIIYCTCTIHDALYAVFKSWRSRHNSRRQYLASCCDVYSHLLIKCT